MIKKPRTKKKMKRKINYWLDEEPAPDDIDIDEIETIVE